MAIQTDNAQLNMFQSLEEEKISQKRVITGNPYWMPQGGDHGPGVMPEEVWKKFSPESTPRTAIGGGK